MVAVKDVVQECLRGLQGGDLFINVVSVGVHEHCPVRSRASGERRDVHEGHSRRLTEPEQPGTCDGVLVEDAMPIRKSSGGQGTDILPVAQDMGGHADDPGCFFDPHGSAPP
jgi:hypothetical protein